MGNPNVNGNGSPVAKAPAVLNISMGSTYQVAPGASIGDLLGDCRCFLGAGLDVFEGMTDGLSEAEWAGMYMLRMAKGLMDIMEEQLPRRLGEAEALLAGAMEASHV